MKRIVYLLLAVMVTATASAQQTTATEVLKTAQRVNAYFMEKYAAPTEPTNVGRIRPSNLWTRAVYYEGLMAYASFFTF